MDLDSTPNEERIKHSRSEEIIKNPLKEANKEPKSNEFSYEETALR